MSRYLPFPEKLYSDELGDYLSFGIRATDAAGHEICSVSDVSVNGQLVRYYCHLFTLCRLQPIHLLDAIVDRLG